MILQKFMGYPIYWHGFFFILVKIMMCNFHKKLTDEKNDEE